MKKKYLLLLAVGFVITLSMQGQITTHELPASFKKDIPLLERNTKSVKVMPTIDMAKIRQEDEEDEANGMPPRFGFRHKVDYNLENSGEWTDLPNGDKIWRLIIHCPGSLSINLLYNKFWIPADAKFFIYSNDKKYSIGAITAANNKGDSINVQGFATGLVYGDTVTLEYYLPDSVKERGIISIAYVVHGYRYIKLFGNTDGNYNKSDTCNINVNCPQGNNWQNEKNAIAMIVVGGTRWCSGSLINTTANDARPLFLTADHCTQYKEKKYDAEGDSILTSWSFYWQYESPDCTSTYDPPYESTSGATLIANDSTSDFALLRLTENPKNNLKIIPYYLGWDRTGNPGTGGVGIHHPSGDIKKISLYDMTPQSTSNGSNTVDSTANHWRVTWFAGITKGGSSGSPLINNSRHIIGQLHGGNSSCDSLDLPDWYGKFSVSWNNSSTNPKRRLSDWLDPNNTGVTVLDGSGCTYYNFTDKNVTTDTPVYACSINVKNVTVSNAKLTLDAERGVNIISNFEVELGAELEIK